MSAVLHLINANPVPEVTSFADHAIAIADLLGEMLEEHREEVTANLAQFRRPWSDVQQRDDMVRWAQWCLDHPGTLRRKHIKLIKSEKPQQQAEAITTETICARVARAIERARKGESPDANANNPFSAYGRFAEQESGGTPLVELVAAPTGSRKSTRMRAEAVTYVAEHPDKSVVILMPRHKLGDEQIELLHKEHPDADLARPPSMGPGIWRRA
jgi:hypothetical protein